METGRECEGAKHEMINMSLKGYESEDMTQVIDLSTVTGSPVWTERVWCVMLNTGSVGWASLLWRSGHLDPQYEAFYWVQGWWEGSHCFSLSECSGLSSPPSERENTEEDIRSWKGTAFMCMYMQMCEFVLTSGLSLCVFTASTFREIDSTLHPLKYQK